MDKTYFFISDIHLGLGSHEDEKSKEKLLLKFLRYAEKECDELFIVGDLFDHWFEYKYVIQKGFIRILSALSEFHDNKKQVHYLIGNHDFLHRDFFETEINVVLYKNPIDVNLNGKKFYIGHGDGLVQNDFGYKILKGILRNRFLQKAYSVVHPDLGIKIASLTSRTSRDYTTQKKYGAKDGLFETAKIKIDEGYDYIIFGHSHERAFKNYKNGIYINLGAWLDKPCFGKFINKFEIIDWE